MAVLREADEQNALSPEGDLGCQGSPGARQKDRSSNGKSGRVAAGLVCVVEETLAELVPILFGGLKKQMGAGRTRCTGHSSNAMQMSQCCILPLTK